MDVSQFMRDEPIRQLALADNDGVTQCDSSHLRTKQSGLEADSKQVRVRGLRQLIDEFNSNQIGPLDTDRNGKLPSQIRQRLARRQRVSRLSLGPGHRKRQQLGERGREIAHREPVALLA